jgi:hypothetical protein
MATKIKNLSIVLVAIIGLSAIGFLAWDKLAASRPVNYDISPGPVVNAKAEIVIEGPKEVAVGHLARLDVTKSAGKTFKWRILPEGVDFEVYDDGRKVVFSSGTPGEYTFIVACANDNDVDVKVLTIRVGEGVAPNPPSPPNPPAPSAGLQGKVVEWAGLVTSPNKKAEAKKLAESFANVQVAIADGRLSTADEIIAATKDANREALGNSLAVWVPFLEKLQKEMQAQAEAGLLVTLEQHAKIWSEISAGLFIVSR